MFSTIETLRLAFAAAVTLAASAAPALAQTSTAGQCVMRYTRADNMWGSAPDSRTNLGWESITLQAGQKKAFVTDWRFEKTRNDGSTYYGSHGRIHENAGTRVLKVTYKPNAFEVKTFYLDPGQSSYGGVYLASQVLGGHSGDIVEVACP